MVVQISDEELKSRYSGKLSRRTQYRKLIQFWDDDVLDTKNVIEMTAGMPNCKLFPLNSVDLNIPESPQFDEVSFRKASFSLTTPEELPMARSLQYAESNGLPVIRKFAKDIIEHLNPPLYDNWDVIMANGSSDAMFKIFETICDEDSIVLVEEFTFTPVLSNIRATGATAVPIKMQMSHDRKEQGIDVEYLSNLLENWSESNYKHLKKPTVLYTIATGQNPTGMTISLEKRHKIYEIAQRHDILIVEDDPYGYLSFPAYDSENPMNNPYKEGKLTVDEYIKNYLMRSFLTMDPDGRVIRLETFSKVFAPGLRLSFIVANKFLVGKLLDYADITTRAPSGVSQAVLYSTIKEFSQKYNGDMLEGWFQWVMKVAGEYTHRRNVLTTALYKTEAYQKGYFNVLEPSAGMFVSVKLLRHGADIIGDMNSFNKDLISCGVKCVLGHKMAVNKEFSKDNCDFLRVTIAFAEDDEQLQEAAKRIGDGVSKFVKNNST